MPQHALSRFAGWMADSKIHWLKNQLIRYFVNRYPVKMHEAIEPDPFAYKSFNDFFTRALDPATRPLASDLHDFTSPADGVISQMGKIETGRLIQAKNHSYRCTDLLGGDENLAHPFQAGSFITVYLAPQDYHRVHMPIDGYLCQMTYIPGCLFSVNNKTAAEIPELFAKNERVVALFETSIGKVAIILIGAMIVGSIETVWAGTVTSGQNKRENKVHHWQYDKSIYLKRGEEMGRFKLGSTVIVLLESNVIDWKPGLELQESLLMGESLGKLHFK